MIKGLMGVTGVTVTGGSASWPYVPTNNSNPMQGMLRINNSELEVFNGNAWQTVYGSHATVSLDQDVLDLIQWAREQRKIEQKRAELVNKNPALKKAYDAVIRAEENFDLLSTIAVQDEEPGIVVGYPLNSPIMTP